MSSLLIISVTILIVAILVLVLVIVFSKKKLPQVASDHRKISDNHHFFDGLTHVQVQHHEVEKILRALQKHIVGMDYFLHGLLIALLAWGHVLVEGAPGLAKTKTIRLLSSLLALNTKRIQFTPDMLPADLIGVDMFNQSTHSFETFFGPLFTNILLADEINRATPKVQSALLEAMQEKQVSIGGTSYPLAAPFFVLATQNPIEQDGTYPLPEAQLDRFIMKLTVNYPSLEAEKQILQHNQLDNRTEEHVLSAEELLSLQQNVQDIKVSDAIHSYIAQLTVATRKSHQSVAYGVSPRGSLSILALAKAIAFIEGRTEVMKSDVQKVLLPALRHRIILSVQAQMQSLSDEDVLFALIHDSL